MDIRNFFSPPGGAKKTEKPSSEKDSKLKASDKKKDEKKKDEKKKDIKDKDVHKKESKKDATKGKNKKEEKIDNLDVIDIDDSSDTDLNSNKKNVKSKEKKNEKKAKDSPPVNGKGKSPPSTKKKKKLSVSDDEFEDEEVITKKSSKGKKSQRIIESDSDEEPVPKKKTPKEKTKLKKKGSTILVDDSDEEHKPKKTTIDSFMKTPSPDAKKRKVDLKKKESSEKKTPVSVADFFGSAAVKRTDRTVVANKRKLEEIEIKNEDVEMHDDDDFQKTLEQLDEQKPKKARLDTTPKKSPGKSSPVKTTEDESQAQAKPSLASKLAAKSKKLVEDTPVKEKSDLKKATTLVPDTPVVKSPKKVSPSKTSESSRKVMPKKTSPSASKMEVTPKVSPKQKDAPKTSPAKTEKSPETPALERKATYRSYLQREGPRALGSKEIPEGADNCLEGLTFVITGVLESLERDEAKHLIEKYGGKVTTSLSKKTSYIVMGRDCGESKLQKAKNFGTKQLDEDALLNLVKTTPGKKSKYLVQAEESFKKEQKEALAKKKSTEIPSETDKTSDKLSQFERKPSTSTSSNATVINKTDQSEASLLWVDKYKPTTMKQIIGQQGEKSNARKLLNWLNSWHKNQAAGIKPQGKFFGKDDGTGFKAALLSGPPGIGKTTTATIVCKEAGFSYVELNASSTRSKKSLKEVVAESLNNTTMVDFVAGSMSRTHGHKHCLLMDEVDGMAGNEDRGGLQELVQLIKLTKIPVICMCNDRNHVKMRTLSNYCFDLRFQRPRVEQIKGAVMSIAFKEGLSVPAPALNEIILAANQDIRQVIHNLSMWTASEKSVTYEQAKKDSSSAKKDMKLGPFDVCRKVFVGGDETAGMTINDKSDLFFNDYMIAPLFVQENYIHVSPYSARGDIKRHLSQLARTADSIADGDIVSRKIGLNQAWSLLPTQAIFASVLPGEYMRGSLPQMVTFPSWLGKNSSTGKTDRVLQELRTHMRLQISGDKRSLNMDYLPYFRRNLTDPLVQRENDGVPDVIKLMDEYDIIKEDFDNIMEVTKLPNSKDPLSLLSSKTKAAFTRAYNKEVHMTPYSTGVVTKKKRGKGAPADEDEMYEEGEDGAPPAEESDEDKDNVELDSMIKAKKKTNESNKGKESGAKGSSQSSKGKGQGKGRGKGKR